jgi:hypothetical protein
MTINETKILAIKAVRTARNEVRDARLNEAFSILTRQQYEELYTILDKLEDDLILSEVDEGLDEMEKSVAKIEDINKVINKENKQLEYIAKVLDVAAKSMRLLIKVASITSSYGVV